jgi:hypothetical protein
MTISKLYFSNLSPVWPLSKQEAVLSGISGTKFSDELHPAERRGFRINGLPERQNMLRKTTRQVDQIISVASLATFARNAEDLMLALTQASEINATIRDVSANVDIKPSAKAKELKRAAEIFTQGRKRAMEVERGTTGGRKSADMRSAQARKIAKEHEKDWLEYDKTNKQISEESGLSVNTLKAYLGRRVEARARHQGMLKRMNNSYSKRGSVKHV